MTPQEFKANWNTIGDGLLPYPSQKLQRFNLTQPTSEFLTIAGLPAFALPDFYFENTNKLIEQFEFQGNEKEYDKYVLIGGCRDGDILVIDTSDDDKILELYTCDFSESLFVNSSIIKLAEFLILYKNFETEVLEDKNPNEYFQCWNFTDRQFSTLKEKMLLVDKEAIISNGYWAEQLEMMLSLRKEYFNIG